MTPVEVTRGDGPLVLGLPHGATWLPAEVAARLNGTGRALADTDWHIDRLYAGLLPGATSVRATFHRYLIDANRDPSGASLYPGQNTTGLCPVTDFDGRPIWRAEAAPGAAEIAERRRAFHAPYHAALAAELRRVRARHGIAVLYDCHSIRGRIPHSFEGCLPDLNIGTHDGASCAPELARRVRETCEESDRYETVLNGRFKGGWTTRHYGNPAGGVHAIQMEIAQRCYMDESPPWTWRPSGAARLRALLKAVLEAAEDWACGQAARA